MSHSMHDIIETVQKKHLYSLGSIDSSINFLKYDVLPGDILIFRGTTKFKPGELFYSIVICVEAIQSLNEQDPKIRSIVTLFNVDTSRTERIFPSEEYGGCPNESAGFSGIEIPITDIIRP